MPTYVYKCEKCKKEKEIFHKMAETCSEDCNCGGKLKKKIVTPFVHMRGNRKEAYKTNAR